MIPTTLGQNPYTPDGAPADAEYVVYRLEEAGATLLALPSTGYTTRLRTSVLDVVRETADAFAAVSGRVRAPVPSAARITRMDEALSWITHIPLDRHVLRRIVGARSLVSPVTERHLFTWRRLAATLGADHKAVQRWHTQGVAIIVNALNGANVNGAATKPARVNAGGLGAGRPPAAGLSSSGLSSRRAPAAS